MSTDNITLPDGRTLRARDVGGVLHPLNLLEFGATPQELDVGTPLPASPFAGRVVRRVPVSVGAVGSNALLPAVAGRGLCVVSGLLMAAGSVSIRFEAAGNALTGDLPLMGAGSGFLMPECILGHFETSAGQGLSLVLSAAVAVGGYLNVLEVP